MIFFCILRRIQLNFFWFSGPLRGRQFDPQDQLALKRSRNKKIMPENKLFLVEYSSKFNKMFYLDLLFREPDDKLARFSLTII